MNKFLDFYNLDEIKIMSLINKIFKNEHWVKVFLNDDHHGFIHGNQVRLSCFKLVEKLNSYEKEKLLKEGKKICKNNFNESALVAIEIAAIFHDCGRFNGDGEVVAEEQKYHHILSAKRAKIFCESINLEIIIPYVEEAILCHDFQSKILTPDLDSPKTIIGKIVQSSDQMGWFHPDSINRTLNFSLVLGLQFYDSKAILKDRLKWKPGEKSNDALTVMLNQLFGPTGIDRFGIEFGRLKIEKYKFELEKNILKLAKEFDVELEVISLIENFKNNL